MHESIGQLEGSADLDQGRLTSAGLTHAFMAIDQLYSPYPKMASAGMTWLFSTWSLILQKTALSLSWWWKDSERGWNTQSLWSQKLESIYHHFFHSLDQSNTRPNPQWAWENGIDPQRYGNPGPIYHRDGATKQTLKSQILNHYSTAISLAIFY